MPQGQQKLVAWAECY